MARERKLMNVEMMNSRQLKRLLADGPMTMKEFAERSGYSWGDLETGSLPLDEVGGENIQMKCFIIYDCKTVYRYRYLLEFPPVLKRMMTLQEVLDAPVVSDDVQLFAPHVINRILGEFWRDTMKPDHVPTWGEAAEFMSSNALYLSNSSRSLYSLVRRGFEKFGVGEEAKKTYLQRELDRRHRWMKRKADGLTETMPAAEMASKLGITEKKLLEILSGRENAFVYNARLFADAFGIDRSEILGAELGIVHEFAAKDLDEPLHVEVRESDDVDGRTDIFAYRFQWKDGRAVGIEPEPFMSVPYPEGLLRTHSHPQMEEYAMKAIISLKK